MSQLAHTEVIDRRDDRDAGLVDLVESRVAGLSRAQEMVPAFDALHFLDVDSRVESLAFGGEDDDANVFICVQRFKGVVDLPGISHGDRVHGWVMHDHLGDVILDRAADGHGLSFS